MAALSFFSNWGCSSLDHYQQLKSDSLSFHQQSQPQPQLSSSTYNFTNNIEPLVYATNELSPLLPNMMCSNPPEYNLLSYSPESYYFTNFEDHDYESFWYPKRHKVNENNCPILVDDDAATTTTTSYLFNAYVQNHPIFVQDDEFVPIDAILPPILPEDQADHQYIGPVVFNNSSCDHQKNKELNNPNIVLSAQSIAARQRRRKITEKTQELGKLIPGGNKMNTAEMFQAASKYVKFLQSQGSLLQFMASFQEEKKEAKEIQGLKMLASPIIQEKLYTEEMCLVPTQLLETLASDDDIQSKPFLKNNINQLLMGKQSSDN